MAFKDFDIRQHMPSGFQSTLGGQAFSVRGVVGVDGQQEVEKNLATMITVAVTESMNSNKVLATKLLEMSRNFVPYDQGFLFNTGRIVENNVAWRGPYGPKILTEYIVTYGGSVPENPHSVDYALLVHENPNGHDFNKHPERWPAGYPGPKQSHYLSTPAEILKPQVRPTIADAVQEAVIAAIARAKAAQAASMRPRLVKRS